MGKSQSLSPVAASESEDDERASFEIPGLRGVLGEIIGDKEVWIGDFLGDAFGEFVEEVLGCTRLFVGYVAVVSGSNKLFESGELLVSMSVPD